MYIREQVQKIDHLLTEFRTSPETANKTEFQSLLYYFRRIPDNIIEHIEVLVFYDESTRFWLEENKGADILEVSHELLSIYIRGLYPRLTENSLEELKFSIPKKRYSYVINEIAKVIKAFDV